MSNIASKRTKKTVKSVETVEQSPVETNTAQVVAPVNVLANEVSKDESSDLNNNNIEIVSNHSLNDTNKYVKYGMSPNELITLSFRCRPLSEKREIYTELISVINEYVAKVKAFDELRLRYLNDLSDEIDESTTAEEYDLNEDENIGLTISLNEVDKDKKKKTTRKKANTTELNVADPEPIKPQQVQNQTSNQSVVVPSVESTIVQAVEPVDKKKSTRKKVIVDVVSQSSEQPIPIVESVETTDAKKKAPRKKAATADLISVVETVPVELVSEPSKKKALKKKTT